MNPQALYRCGPRMRRLEKRAACLVLFPHGTAPYGTARFRHLWSATTKCFSRGGDWGASFNRALAKRVSALTADSLSVCLSVCLFATLDM